jgi:hypothetical protein
MSYQGNVAVTVGKSGREYCVMTKWYYHWECTNTTAIN